MQVSCLLTEKAVFPTDFLSKPHLQFDHPNCKMAEIAESQLTTEQQVKSIWHLGGLNPTQLAKRVWAEIDHDNVFNRASELAYNFLFAVFPLLLFLLGLLGIFASHAPALKQELISAFARVLPGDAYTLVSTTLEEIVKSSGGGKMTFGVVL